ncbi:hypothetical protein DFAR_3900011 [Desulfarculales bacterium]
MADIVQADVVVTQTNDDEDYTGQRTNIMRPSIAFGNASLTYPTYGIPLPDLSKFRLKSHIKRLRIQEPIDAYIYRYDPTVRAANPVAPYGTIRMIVISSGAEFSGAIPVTVLPLEIVGA